MPGSAEVLETDHFFSSVESRGRTRIRFDRRLFCRLKSGASLCLCYKSHRYLVVMQSIKVPYRWWWCRICIIIICICWVVTCFETGYRFQTRSQQRVSNRLATEYQLEARIQLTLWTCEAPLLMGLWLAHSHVPNLTKNILVTTHEPTICKLWVKQELLSHIASSIETGI